MKEITEQQIDMANDQIQFTAILCHEVNKAYCEGIGDNSQKPQDDAPDWAKESCINGVLFHLENNDASPGASHENWYKEKAANGWVYGPEKNEEKKTHPCMVPFEELPTDQQVKDHLFKAVVKTMLGV